MSFLIKHKLAFFRAVLIIFGAVLIALGVLREEPSEILRKATVVCLECIGIG